MNNRYDPSEMSAELEKFRSGIKFPNIVAPSNIDAIFQKLSAGNLAGMPALTLMEYGIQLAVYATYIKKEINSKNAIVKWCEANIKYITGQACKDMVGSYYGYNEKEAHIRGSDENAKKLDAWALEAQAKLNILWGLDEQIRFLSGQVNSLAKERSYARRGESL